MRNLEKDAIEMSGRRQRMMEEGFRLFSAKSIDMIRESEQRFHGMYERAKEDGTVRTDISEEEMFAATIHLMLAAATRYAIGLIYVPEQGADAESELLLLKEMLMSKYVV